MKPLVLCILDGYGSRENSDYNAVKAANTPVLNALQDEYSTVLLHSSGSHVGLPAGQMGNSEVGHTAIGLGRILFQDLPKISMAIEDNSLQEKYEIKSLIANLKANGGRCHLWGLLSDGGVHSHCDHLFALIKIFTDNDIDVLVHACLDGRDTPPQSAINFLKQLTDNLVGRARLATVSGRYYAMDRDKRWERTEKAFNTIVHPGEFCENAIQYVEENYANGVLDEFVPPIAVAGYNGVRQGDAFFVFNYRADRVRQMLSAISMSNFAGFERMYGKPKFTFLLGIAEYGADFQDVIGVVFKKDKIVNSLGEVLSNNGLTQLRVAETEKYPHVTFFFNGGKEDAFSGEERVLIASPQVATYDLSPKMSASKIADVVVDSINDDVYDVYVMNFANADMVGHTGKFDAVVAAIDAIDKCVYDISQAVLRKGGCLIITADHGNAEEMYDYSAGQVHTAHTTNDVIFTLVCDEYKGAKLKQGRGLQDIALTILDILKIDPPQEMTGTSLFR